MKTALILVDIQNDFLPGGALAVKEGDKILPIVNRLTKMPFDYILATKDWHPENHQSFATVHNKQVGEVINLNGIPQILWPVHCVQNSIGAQFSPAWDTSVLSGIFYKGKEVDVDSYSTFFDNQHKNSTGLGQFLRDNKIDCVFFAGLATDYCVKYSVLDALALGLKVYVIADACRAVNLNPGDEEAALQAMKQEGAEILISSKVPETLTSSCSLQKTSSS